jgi:hypothetical protein
MGGRFLKIFGSTISGLFIAIRRVFVDPPPELFGAEAHVRGDCDEIFEERITALFVVLKTGVGRSEFHGLRFQSMRDSAQLDLGSANSRTGPSAGHGAIPIALRNVLFTQNQRARYISSVRLSGGRDDPTIEHARLIAALLFTRSRRQLFANAAIAASRVSA